MKTKKTILTLFTFLSTVVSFNAFSQNNISVDAKTRIKDSTEVKLKLPKVKEPKDTLKVRKPEKVKDTLHAKGGKSDSLKAKLPKVKEPKDTLKVRKPEKLKDTLHAKGGKSDSLKLKLPKVKEPKDTLKVRKPEKLKDTLHAKGVKSDSLRVKLPKVKDPKDTLKVSNPKDSSFNRIRVVTVIAPNPSTTGTNTITIDRPETEGFTLTIYSNVSIVHSQEIQGGITTLPVLAQGVFHYAVTNAEGKKVSSGRIMIVN